MVLFSSGPLFINSRVQEVPCSCYPVIIMSVVHVDSVVFHPTFLLSYSGLLNLYWDSLTFCKDPLNISVMFSGESGTHIRTK